MLTFRRPQPSKVAGSHVKKEFMQNRPALLILACYLAFHAASRAQVPMPAPAAEQPPPKPSDSKPAIKPSDAKPPQTGQAPQQVEKIEVKTSQENYDARREDTATKIVVTEEEIVKYGDTQLADVLKRQPGITVTGNEIRMRGLGSGYTQILLNGERAPPGFSLDTLSPGMVERIEIIRAATAEFSTQSIAGTINVILKKKVVVAQREIKFGYGHGRGFENVNSNFVVSNKDGNFSYSVNSYYYHAENKDFLTRSDESGTDGNGVPTIIRRYENTFSGIFEGIGVTPRFNWTLDNGDTVTALMFANYNRARTDNDRRYVIDLGPDVPYPISRTHGTRDDKLTRGELNWVHKLAQDAKLDLKVTAGVGDREADSFQRAFNRSNTEIFDSFVNTTSKDTTFTFTGKYSTPIVEGHALVAGWDTSQSKRRETQNQVDRNLSALTPIATLTDFDASVVKLAAFVQDEWNITSEWSLYLGLRWEGLNTTSDGNTYDEVRNRSSVWSPLMQTLYKFPDRKGEQVRLALTRTYKAPNTSSLIPRRFTSTNNSPTEPDFEGNRFLKPELATGIDVAYEKFWDQGAMMSLSAAVRRITDFNRDGLLLVNGRWVTKPINDGTATTKSLEFDTKLPLQKFLKEAPPIDFRFNMNRNWSTVDSVPGPNNRLAQQTPFSATLGLDYRMQGGVVVAGTSFTFKSGGDVRISANQSRYLNTRRDLDFYALWKVTPKTQLRFTLGNVLGQDYYNRSSYFDAFGSIRRTDISPSTMNYRINLEVKF